MKRAPWFPHALRLAFLALVALVVSPAFAFHCCCSAAPHQTAAISHHEVEPATHSCCAEHGEMVVKSVCECATAETAPFVASDAQNFAFFAPVFAVLPSQIATAAPQIEAQRAAFPTDTARPRSPDLGSHSGRAPPVLALS